MTKSTTHKASTTVAQDLGSATRVRNDHVLTLSCVDRPGIVYRVAKFLLEQGGTITESQQFSSPESGTFFMRVAFSSPRSIETLSDEFTAVAIDLELTWRLIDATAKRRVVILVSKYGHCLNDLLFRGDSGGLPIEVPAVISNHPDLGVLADNYHVPFFHVPVSPTTKEQAESQIMELIDSCRPDLVVLARYMQILSADMCKRLDGRAINIHHSMLPSFKGARPYFQAYDRGVKLVGATAHYVTSDLDEGPIIEQEVARVDHSMSAEDVTALGRDNESLALSRAVRWHCENRVLLDGHRTVVFR